MIALSVRATAQAGKWLGDGGERVLEEVESMKEVSGKGGVCFWRRGREVQVLEEERPGIVC